MKEDLYLIKINNLYGYINYSGEIVINPIYKYAQEFSDGLTKVITIEGKSYFINTKNEKVLEYNSNMSLKFENGFINFNKDGKYGFMNKNGEIIITPQFDYIWRGFNKYGFAIIKKNGKYGTIDRSGNYIIEPKFSMLGEYSEGGMGAVYNEKSGLIDINGNTIIDFKYESIGNMSEGFISIKENNRWGFIDKTGKEVIKPEYRYVTEFKNGLASVLVEKNRKMGAINKNGINVIKPLYDEFEEFSEGIAAIGKDDLYGYIDINGKEIVKRVFLTANKFKNGLGLVTTRGDVKWGYVNKKGEWVYKPKDFNLC